MAAFAEVLRSVAARVPESELLMVIGTDGIPIEKLTVRSDPNLEAVAAEHTTLLRASLAAAADTGLGSLQELAISGVINVALEEKDGATTMVVTHRVSGDATHKLDAFAPIVDQVNGLQFGNLAAEAPRP